MALTRVLRTAKATLAHTFEVDESAVDAGAVTVDIKRLDGTAVVTGGAATPGTGNRYTIGSPPSAVVDLLTVDWKGTVNGVAVVERDHLEIVGGFLFGLGEARAKPPPLDVNKHPTAELVAARLETELECERICGQAFVTRFERAALSGTGSDLLATPRRGLSKLRAVIEDGTPWSSQEVAAVAVLPGGVLARPGGTVWPPAIGAAYQNLVIEYEHGMWYPYPSEFTPEDLRLAAIIRARSRLGLTASGVSQRAQSYTTQDGSVYRLALPSGERTGLPEVDGVYQGYTPIRGGFA